MGRSDAVKRAGLAWNNLQAKATISQDLFGAGIALAARFHFDAFGGVRLQKGIKLALRSPRLFIVIEAGISRGRVKHDWISPSGQAHDDAGRLAREKFSGALGGLSQPK